jgi:hypothetical protein
VSVLEFHRQLRDVAEDQLSLAAVHYLRAHYQEAIDIYKRLVLQNKDLMALHVCNNTIIFYFHLPFKLSSFLVLTRSQQTRSLFCKIFSKYIDC